MHNFNIIYGGTSSKFILLSNDKYNDDDKIKDFCKNKHN